MIPPSLIYDLPRLRAQVVRGEFDAVAESLGKATPLRASLLTMMLSRMLDRVEGLRLATAIAEATTREQEATPELGPPPEAPDYRNDETVERGPREHDADDPGRRKS